MKRIFILITLISFFQFSYSQIGGQWVKKADVSTSNREGAIGFAINTKGYIGLGNAGGAPSSALWEYDISTNVWTQKANMTGGGRVNPVVFVISGNAYIGTGEDNTFTRDKKFYQYNPSSNVWTAKLDFGGTGRTEAVAFTIGSKGYVGTGYDGTRRKDFWEYDATSNTWTQKADFGGTARQRATGFSIDTKGYIGTGNDGARKKDFWEYDQATNTWLQKGDFAGLARESAVGFSILGKGYIATGDSGTGKADIWEYSPANDEWIQRADFIGQRRYDAAVFASSTNSKAYIGTGFTDEPSTGTSTKDFYEFTPAQPPMPPTKAMVTSFSETSIRIHWLDNSTDETGFSIERSSNGISFAVIATTSANAIYYTDNGLTTGQLYYYRVRATKTTDGSSSATNIVSQTTGKNENGVWTLINDPYSGGPNINDGTSTFTINNIIYLTGVGGTSSSTLSKDCWAYDNSTNTYTQKANFGGQARNGAVAFTLNNKGYVGTGLVGASPANSSKDFWQYDPLTNQWTQKSDMGASNRYYSFAFTANNKAYVGGGVLSTGNASKDFYEYDADLDTWTAKTDFPFITSYSLSVSYQNKGYVVSQATSPASIYEYDPGTNLWILKSSFPVRSYGFKGASLVNDRILFVTHFNNTSTLWEYELTKERWIERAVQSTESSYSNSTTATSSNKLYLFTGKALSSYSPLYGLKSPAGVTATVIDPLKIRLTWSIPDLAATHTSIYRATDINGPYTLVIQLTSDKKTYVDSFDGVTQSAYYQLRSTNTTSQSENTTSLLATKQGAWSQLKSTSVLTNFSIGDVAIATSKKGYVGLGGSNKNWWEYDPATDSWTQKASFTGDSRTSSSSFAINDQVYVGFGFKYTSATNTTEILKDFWQYDPTTNTWAKKNDFTGTARRYAATTTSNGKGYLVGGEDDPLATSFLNDAWEYNPSDDSWKELSKMPTGLRSSGIFVYDNKLNVYNGLYKSSSNSYGSTLVFYQLDLTSNTWIKGSSSLYPFAGQTYQINDVIYASIYSMVGYNLTTKKLLPKPPYPGASSATATFSLNKKIYVVGNSYDVWVYNPESVVAPPENLTSQFLGDRISLAWQTTSTQPVKTKIQYVISGSTYIDLATIDEGVNQFIFNNPSQDRNYKFKAISINTAQEQSSPSNFTFENTGSYWAKIGSVPIAKRSNAISFASSGKIYYGLGKDVDYFKDLWEYDAASGVWTQKADFPGEERTSWTTFALGNDNYVGFGRGKVTYSLKDLWKYNSTTNTWTTAPSYPNNNGIDNPGVFVSNGNAYLMGGILNYTATTNELWRFNGTTWTQLTSLPGETRSNPIAFSIGGKGYIGSGQKVLNGSYYSGSQDFWEYTIATDTWKQLTDLPQDIRLSEKSFTLSNSNNAILISNATSGTSNGFGVMSTVYNPIQDKWTSLGNRFHQDYLGTAFSFTQDPTSGFGYAIINHSEYGVSLWRFNYLLSGPNLVEAQLSAPNTARLKWRKITPQPDSVVIYRSEAANTIGTRVGSVKTADTTAINTVVNGKTYYYRIRSYSNSGQFKTSADRTLFVDNPPVAPIDLTGELVNDKIELKWKPGAGAIATTYTIERSVNSTTDFKILGTATTTSFSSAELPGQRLSYWVKASNLSGDSPYSNIALVLVTAVESEIENVRVYPNPVDDFITVQVHPELGPLSVQMIDNKGRKLYTNTLNSTTRIDMTNLPTGIYFINLSSSKSNTNKQVKVIKK